MTAVNTTLANQTPATPRLFYLEEEWLAPRFVVITALAMLASWASQQLGANATLTLAFNLISYAAGGFFGARNALVSLFKERKLDVDMLMILAALGAAVIDQWHEGALLLFLFSLSNVLQDYAIGRSRQAIKSLFKLYPETAQVRRDGKIVTLKLNDIRVGDIVLIQPAERIAVDGVVISGQSSVDESPITGESLPVDKGVGDIVYAGTLNKQGLLDIRATKSASETTLARVIQMVEEAQESQAPTERFLDRFEQAYATFIIAAVGLIIVIPPLLFDVAFASNFYRAMVLMTVASPCALVISVPASFISAIASGARMGVLLKGGAYLEELARVNAVAFDKTGTLTQGKPDVTDILPHDVDEAELLGVAASVEARSEHPIARAVVQAAQARGLPLTEVSAFEALVGRGLVATLAGARVEVGSMTHLAAITPPPAPLQAQISALEAQGKTLIGVLREGVWLGALAVADQVRPQARAVVRQLHDMGIATAMFTGDNAQVAHHIAQELGIQRVHAQLMPEDKVTVLKQLMDERGVVAMVGDGVNDAPALATASVGLAMGGAGTDVAMETADVVLMSDKLERIVDTIKLARLARRVVWQNISFSIAVIVLLIISVFVVSLPLPLGVLGHEGSTVIVVTNGLVQLLLLPELARRRAQTSA